jgi:hypothetical protein
MSETLKSFVNTQNLSRVVIGTGAISCQPRRFVVGLELSNLRV